MRTLSWRAQMLTANSVGGGRARSVRDIAAVVHLAWPASMHVTQWTAMREIQMSTLGCHMVP